MRILAFACILAPLAAADVVIENFDDAYKGQTTLGWKLGPAAKAGYWYGYDDWNHGAAGLGTTMTPDVVHKDTNFLATVVDDCGDANSCLHVNYLGGSGYDYPFAGVGFNFLSEGKDVDLSKMDSITFRAKGSGRFRFKLLTKHITDDFDKSNYWADMGTNVLLGQTWKNYTIRLKDIKPEPGAPKADTVTWQQCMDHVRKIHLATPPGFATYDVTDLWIDDIVMHGVGPETFGGVWTESVSRNGRLAASPESVRISDGSLRWDPRSVRSIELVSADGRSRIPADASTGSLSMHSLPQGAWIAKTISVDESAESFRFATFR